jgi:hypothetical protein
VERGASALAKEPESGPSGIPPPQAPPATVAEALARAREHGRLAAAETLIAIQALLDAAALAGSGQPLRAHRQLAPLARLLEGLASDLARRGDDGPEPLLAAIAEALDLEIARWERRAQEDLEARAVLRAFLGLREILWEIGVRSGRSASKPRPGPQRARQRPAGSRVQRVPVQG